MGPNLEWESRLDHLDKSYLESQLEVYTAEWGRALGEDEFGLEALRYANKVRDIKNAIAIHETPGVTPEYTHFDRQVVRRQEQIPAHDNMREMSAAQVIFTTLRMIVNR